MKIAIVNDIHVGKALVHNGVVRASSNLIEERLEEILQQIIQQHSPDLLVNMGDLIRSEEKTKDLDVYAKLLSIFKKLETPVIHLFGNHELKKMGAQESNYGSYNLSGVRIIWLGLELDRKDPAIHFLPNAQLSWLKKELDQTDLPTLIFSHVPLDDQDTTGNYFYEAMDNQSKKALFLHNQDDVRKIITSSPTVKAVFQAHLHYYHIKLIGSVPYVTCPAMGDNICGPHVHDNIPEIYTIIHFDQQKLTVKAYSREYCFAGFEHFS